MNGRRGWIGFLVYFASNCRWCNKNCVYFEDSECAQKNAHRTLTIWILGSRNPGINYSLVRASEKETSHAQLFDAGELIYVTDVIPHSVFWASERLESAVASASVLPFPDDGSTQWLHCSWSVNNIKPGSNRRAPVPRKQINNTAVTMDINRSTIIMVLYIVSHVLGPAREKFRLSTGLGIREA